MKLFNMKFFSKKKGFTLLELMIVVIIVGILASLALPRFIAATQKARESEAKSILGSIRAAQLRYFLEFSVYTSAIANLDVGLTASNYYDFTALDGTGPNNSIGQGAPVAGDPHSLTTYNIDENGTIF